MGRDSRGGYRDYDERDGPDRTPPRGTRSGSGSGSGPSRGGPPRGGQTPPSRPGPSSRFGQANGNGRGTPASDPRGNGRAGSGPRSARAEAARRRPPQRDESAAYEAPPPRTGRSRRSVSLMARDLSRAMSRQLGAMVRGTERAVRRSAGPRRADRAAFAGSFPAGELPTELTPQPYRRSRIRMRARKWRMRRVPPNPIKYFIMLGAVAMLVVTLLGASGAGTIYAISYYNQRVPQIQALAANLQGGQSSVIYDRNGKILYTVKDGNSSFNYYVPLSQVSTKLRNATIDTEDHSFYSSANIGIDFQSLLRAGLRDASDGGAQQGGSTITQQLVKNLVLENRSKVIARKLNEAILAVGVTLNYNKDQILEMYLNSIDYGDQNQGIEAAARNFFGLTAKTLPDGTYLTANQQLDWAQAAILSGLPNAPTYYLPRQYSCATTCPDTKWANPCVGDPRNANCMPSDNYDNGTDGHEWLVWRRARLVLDNLLKYNDINQADHDKAVQEVHDILQQHKVLRWAGLRNGNVVDTTKNAPHFVDYLLGSVLPKEFGIDPSALPRAGLKIYTTLDLDLDTYAQQRLKYYIQGDANGYFTNSWYCGSPIPPINGCPNAALGNAWNVHNGAFTAIDPNTGDILAMVGSVDYGSKDPQVQGYNNIATALRSMGSSTKALVYATAFQMGWNPSIMLQDKTICFPNPAVDPSTNKPIVTNDFAPACKGWYSPTNYTQQSFSGVAPIRPLLANSLNIPATEAMSFVGSTAVTASAFLAMTRRLGITTLSAERMGPSTALGSQEIPLLQLTGAYATFAASGVRHPYRSILRIEDHLGNVLYQAPPAPAGQQVMSPQTTYELTSILTDNQARLPDFGYYNPLYFDYKTVGVPDHPGFQIAAKTGTSEGVGGPNDIVTMGYSPYLAVGVWFGNTDGKDPLKPGIIGIAGAGYVFHDVMDWAITRYRWPEGSKFPIPAGMARGQFNCATGLAPYKSAKPENCPFKPQFPKVPATNIYQGFNDYGDKAYAPNIDWYIQGQAPLQS
ncbi:MAG: transglycosylase domain-containing protein [Ktedonobacterales bacterium]|nr:transglycosylase domain-containing protein [Ktedonobacterales bacterium]